MLLRSEEQMFIMQTREALIHSRPKEWNVQRPRAWKEYGSSCAIRVMLYSRKRGYGEGGGRGPDSKGHAGPVEEFGLCPEDNEDPWKRKTTAEGMEWGG